MNAFALNMGQNFKNSMQTIRKVILKMHLHFQQLIEVSSGILKSPQTTKRLEH